VPQCHRAPLLEGADGRPTAVAGTAVGEHVDGCCCGWGARLFRLRLLRSERRESGTAGVRTKAIDHTLTFAQQDVARACRQVDVIGTAKKNTEELLASTFGAVGWTVACTGRSPPDADLKRAQRRGAGHRSTGSLSG